MKRKYILILFTLLNTFFLFPQAGKGVYRFLDLPVSSRLAAIGGTNISIRDFDINFSLTNPALLTSETSGIIGINAAKYLSTVNFGSAVYGHNFGENNFMSFGVQYVDYGKFPGYDEIGNFTEDFTAKDFALFVSYARPLNDYFTLGATLKPIFSAYEKYNSIGIAFDMGMSYKKELFSAGLVLRNIGAQLKGYYVDESGQHREALPFDIQLGISKKFAHAPLRLSLTLNNLQRWDVVNYQSNNNTQTDFDGNVTVKKMNPFDMAFRHAIFGVEILPSDNFYLALGYNHRRHQELTMDGFKSLAGFSFGGGVKLYKFQVGFGMSQFQLKNYSYQVSISTNLNEFVSF